MPVVIEMIEKAIANMEKNRSDRRSSGWYPARLTTASAASAGPVRTAGAGGFGSAAVLDMGSSCLLAEVLADGGEGLVGRLQHQGEVVPGQGGGHEPVVPGVQVDATAQGLRGEHAGQLVAVVPGEGEIRHPR